MLPERMKKGHYLIHNDGRKAVKIVKVKKHPEYDEERVYFIKGDYGIVMGAYETTDLERCGYTDVVSLSELNQLLRDGKYNPTEFTLHFSAKKIQ
jgi:hypothetical protein